MNPPNLVVDLRANVTESQDKLTHTFSPITALDEDAVSMSFSSEEVAKYATLKQAFSSEQ